jgi:hypothetical protein
MSLRCLLLGEKLIPERGNRNPVVTMQVFQKKQAVLCGINEANAILTGGTGVRGRERVSSHQARS